MGVEVGFQSPLPSSSAASHAALPDRSILSSALMTERSSGETVQTDRTAFFSSVNGIVSRIAEGRLGYLSASGCLVEAIESTRLGPVERQEAYRAAAHGIPADDLLKREKLVAAAGLGIVDVSYFLESRVIDHARAIVSAYRDCHLAFAPGNPLDVWKSPFTRIISMHDFWGGAMCALRGRVELAFGALHTGDITSLHRSSEKWPPLQDLVHGRILALAGLTEMFASPASVNAFYSVRWSQLNSQYEELSQSAVVRAFLVSAPYHDFKALSSGLNVAAEALAQVSTVGIGPEQQGALAA